MGRLFRTLSRVISEGSSTQETVRILEFAPAGTDMMTNGVQVHNYWEELYIVKGSIIDLTLNKKIFTAGNGGYTRTSGMQHGPWKLNDRLYNV